MAAEQSAGLHLGLEHVVAKCDLTWQRSRLIQPPDLLAKGLVENVSLGKRNGTR